MKLRVLLAALLLPLTLSPFPAHPALAAVEPRWGMMGGYGGISLSDLHGRGVRVVVVEMEWTRAEPERGASDRDYFREVRREAREYRRAGFRVVLNFGLHHAPEWLLDKPDMRFVNQYGDTYTASDEPNLIFAKRYRKFGERYIRNVFNRLGTRFIAVRVGGGHWGELQYPQVFGSDGRLKNYYWAFDDSADRKNPVPRWRPGDPSPNNEARKFINWYLGALTNYQNWQIRTVRKYYPGTIAVLYASWGLRKGDLKEAIGTNLDGSSSPEVNGEVQRGYAHARHIRAVRVRNVAAWGTWADKAGTISWLAPIADRNGLLKMGENSGGDDESKMDVATDAARDYGLSLFVWVRANEAYCHCNGYASINDYEDEIED